MTIRDRAPDEALSMSTTPGSAVVMASDNRGVTVHYRRQHLPSGKITEGHQAFDSCRYALDTLARWNIQEPEVWRYWIAAPESLIWVEPSDNIIAGAA